MASHFPNCLDEHRTDLGAGQLLPLGTHLLKDLGRGVRLHPRAASAEQQALTLWNVPIQGSTRAQGGGDTTSTQCPRGQIVSPGTRPTTAFEFLFFFAFFPNSTEGFSSIQMPAAPRRSNTDPKVTLKMEGACSQQSFHWPQRGFSTLKSFPCGSRRKAAGGIPSLSHTRPQRPL